MRRESIDFQCSRGKLCSRVEKAKETKRKISEMTSPVSRLSMSHSVCFLPSFNPNPIKFTPIPLRRRWHIFSNYLRQPRAELSFTVGTHLIPHRAKVHTGGEDAFFVSSSNGGVLAIADGVSGWAERGVNPALFSRELMANASNLVMDEEVNCDPQMLLMKAHAATSSAGSATVIVAMLEKNGILNIAYVGDCGLLIIRKGILIFSTSPQEHYFNCPYQLSSEKAGQTYHDAMVCSVKLLEGDTIVMGSDGFFDNVFDHEILSIISQFKDADDDAKRLADLANTHSTDVNFDSPYSLKARSRGFDVPLWKKALGQKLTGGKPDDITVIVGHVQST